MSWGEHRKRRQVAPQKDAINHVAMVTRNVDPGADVVQSHGSNTAHNNIHTCEGVCSQCSIAVKINPLPPRVKQCAAQLDSSGEGDSVPFRPTDPGVLKNATNDKFFIELSNMRKQNSENPILAYLNINSLRYKHCEIAPALSGKLLDILVLAETKIDASFPDSQFSVDDYHIFRKDRTDKGGGLLAYVRSDLPTRRMFKLETSTIETITLEVTLPKAKWLLICAYKPPSLKNSIFTEEMQQLLDKSICHYEYIIVIGDLHFDMFYDTTNVTPLVRVSPK